MPPPALVSGGGYDSDPSRKRRSRRVRKNVHFPFFRERFEAASVIEMSMRKHDGQRARLFAETLARRAFDKSAHAGHASVDQHPAAITAAGRADENHVHHRETAIGKIGRNFDGAIVGMRQLGDGLGREWDLLRHIRK